MDAASKRPGSDLFIVDNSDYEWKVGDYLREWAQISDRFDIATGYFEVGALLALDGEWQKLDKLRILMGDEVSRRTKKALLAGVRAVEQALDASLEKEKEQNDFLAGVPGIVEAIRKRQTDEILKVIERHTREYSPFEVYAKALQEYFRNHEITVGEWELLHSRMFPVLDQYQKEGYQALMKISGAYRGAFLCDGVGLGKTFIGMMVIERLIMHDRKRVMLLVPKAARKPVWENALKRYLPQLYGDFSNLAVFNHTDLMRAGEYPERLERMKEMADAIVIDEAHHFRNPGVKGTGETAPSRYRRLFEIAEGKTLFLLTATPINNKLIDLQHLIEIFSRREADYFRAAPLGIHSLPGHFRRMEKELEKLVDQKSVDDAGVETNEAEAEQVLSNDALFKALVVQRGRAYVRAS